MLSAVTKSIGHILIKPIFYCCFSYNISYNIFKALPRLNGFFALELAPLVCWALDSLAHALP